MQTIQSHNPRTGESVRDVAEITTGDEVSNICKASVRATKILTAMEPRARAGLLQDMANLLEDSREHLVAIGDVESALGTTRLNSELTRTANQLRLFSEVLRDGACFEATVDHSDQGATPPQPDLRRMLTSLGPVAVFGASNFPFAFSAAGGDTASALAAGCAVVVKAHGAHPHLDAEVVSLLRQVCVSHGLPAETVGIVYGREAATALVDDENIKAVGFTGSEHVGRMLMDRAAARKEPIPFYAEMGSLNPLVVSPRAASERTEEVAKGIAASATMGHGQFCTKPGLVFVPVGHDGDLVVQHLTATFEATDPQFMLSVSIRDSYRNNVRKVQSVPSVTPLVNQDDPKGSGSLGSPALAEIGARQLIDDQSSLIEMFGPAALVVRYEDTMQLVAALALVPAALTMTLQAQAEETHFISEVAGVGSKRVGRLLFNGYPTGVAVNWAQHHGGPYPAAASALFTSVGATAIRRFFRPVAFQDWPDQLLPKVLQESNPLGVPRRVDGQLNFGTEPIVSEVGNVRD